MTGEKHLDFELEIELEADGYQASASWQGGQAKRRFGLPFSDDELRQMGEKIQSEGDAEAWGQRLFEAVFQDDVRICLENCRSRARFEEGGVRLRLRLGDAPQLTTLPWECLFDPARQSFFALAVETPVVRFVDMLRTSPVLPVRPPLRILVMVSSPRDSVPLDVELEKAHLQEALGHLIERGKVVLDILEDARLRVLQTKLRQVARADEGYHIFHFVGHGLFDERGREGRLILEDKDGLGHAVTGRQLGTYLAGHHTLRLAMLNACEGAKASGSEPLGAVARVLVRQGIPAVVAMRAEISDEAAVEFTREFYAALAEGWSVDVALTEGRKAVYALSEVEWATPALYLGVADGRVFDLSAAVRPPEDSEQLIEPPASMLQEETFLPAGDPRREALLEWATERSGPQIDASEAVLIKFLQGGSLSEVERSVLLMALSVADQTLAARLVGPEPVADEEILDALERLRQLELSGPSPEPSKQVVNVAGQWRSPVTGEGLVIYQQGTMITIRGYDAFNQSTGQGGGQVMGREVLINFRNSALSLMVSARLALSPDGMTLSGIVSVPGMGNQMATYARVG